MGFQAELNWALKLSELDSSLTVGKEYDFEKKDIRLYPIDMPIDLLDKNWEAVGSCIILTVTYSKVKTIGKFKILELYEGDKKKILTEQWRNVLKYTLGNPNITNFSSVRITE